MSSTVDILCLTHRALMSSKVDILCFYKHLYNQLLAPAVTVSETEGAMDSTSFFFASFFAYNFVRK